MNILFNFGKLSFYKLIYQHKIKFIIIAAFLSIFTYGCSEDETTDPPDTGGSLNEHTIHNLPADTASLGKATYFRFNDSTVVTGADTSSVKWDIAFKATNIYTNSGSSGPGQGGVVILKNTNFSNVTAAPDTGYKTDAPGAPGIPGGSGNGWYIYDFSTNIISPLAGLVLVIRTGDGKYAKVQILNYYKGAPAVPGQTDRSRFYTFKYLYKSNGSKSFQ